MCSVVMVSSAVPVANNIRNFGTQVENVFRLNKHGPCAIESQQESDGKIFNFGKMFRSMSRKVTSIVRKLNVTTITLFGMFQEINLFELVVYSLGNTFFWVFNEDLGNGCTMDYGFGLFWPSSTNTLLAATKILLGQW